MNRGFVHRHSLLALTNQAFTSSGSPTNSGINEQNIQQCMKKERTYNPLFPGNTIYFLQLRSPDHH